MIVRSVMILCIMLRKQLLLSAKNVVMHCIRNVSSSVCCHWFSNVMMLIKWEDEKSALQTGKTLTCVWCRSEHGIKGNAKPTTLKMQRGPFINLASTIPSIAGLRRTCMSNSSFRRGLGCIEAQEFVINPFKREGSPCVSTFVARCSNAVRGKLHVVSMVWMWLSVTSTLHNLVSTLDILL